MNNKYLHLLLFLLLLTPCSKVFSQNQQIPLFKFGVVADVQYTNRKNHKTRHYRSSLHKLEEAVEVFNEKKVDFVVSLETLLIMI